MTVSLWEADGWFEESLIKGLIKCGQGTAKPEEIVWDPRASNSRDTITTPMEQNLQREKLYGRGPLSGVETFSQPTGILKGQIQGNT